MNINSMRMVIKPLMSMVKNMVPHEAPKNSSAVFVKDIIDVFFPEMENEEIASFEEIITDIAVVGVNNNPEVFKEKLIILEGKIRRFLDREVDLGK